MARQRKITTPEITMTKIIRDTRDGSMDYELPLDKAIELYKEGKLDYDLTNSAYCHPTNGMQPKFR